MHIEVEKISVVNIETPLLILNIFEGVKSPQGATKAVDEALGDIISNLIEEGEIKGKLKETRIIHTHSKISAKRVIVVGLGKPQDFNYDVIRTVTAASLKEGEKLGIKKVATIVHGAGIGGLTPQLCAQALTEGAILGTYRFDKYKKREEEPIEELKIVELNEEKIKEFREGVRIGKITAEAQNIARDLINEPGNILTPREFAKRIKEKGDEVGIEVEVFDEEKLKEMRMGLILGVGQGSAEPPRLIILRYKSDPGSEKWYGIVGKGVMFDSGGISIKPAESMETMKGDMAGGAITFATIYAAAKLGIKKNLLGLIPAVFNMPGGNAIRPGDILKGYNGKTVEIISTDAEGRLILGDALSYAEKLGADPIIDIATLTGGSIVAFGDVTSAVFSSDEKLTKEIIEASRFTGEKMWEMPLFPEYKEQIKSECADIKNFGGRKASPITAAIFLKEFISKARWLHIDVAGKEIYEKERNYLSQGGTGIGTRTLIHWLMQN